MRLFGYYALHSFVNQLRKLFKTWVLVFLVVCIAMGVLIGFGAAALEDTIEDNSPQVEVVEEEAEDEEFQLPIEGTALLELIAGGVVLAFFVFEAVSADKNGSKIFLPADVNLLFSSPMKPQSVLMFRLATQLGTALIASIYILFQLPNLILNLGLSGWAAAAILITYFACIFIGKLLQVMLYTVCSTNIGFKKYLSRSVYALVIVLGAAFYGYYLSSGVHPLVAADRFFNAPFTRWIPFWGWLKGLAFYVAAQQWGLAAVCLVLLAAGSAGLTYVIWNINADFYEDAMAKSEETAALMEKARSEKTSGTAVARQRKKDRSEKLRRDGMKRGWGASVFFWKAMYNRFRFAHLGFFTKTMETYFVTALGVAFAADHFFGYRGELPVVLALGVVVFFRAMGNPMTEDTGMDFFRLIPESTWQKLFFSLLGGTVNSLLDLLPPMLAASALLMVNPMKLLLWLPLILSVDFYATSVVTFIDLSVPASIGKTIKQIITIFFIYFGLLPDLGLLAFGIALGYTVPAAIGSTALNLALGVAAFSLASVFLQPKGRDYIQAQEQDLTQARKRFSWMGFCLFFMVALVTLVQFAAAQLVVALFPAFLENVWGLWLVTFAPQYLIALPITVWMLRRVPGQRPQVHPLGAARGVKYFFICIFMMYGGNLIGTLITTLLGLLRETEVVNPLMSFVTGENLLAQVLFLVVLAPLFEELLFRRMLIDRMRPYGGKTAVVLSAALFGLFHGNLSQFFYAFGLGLVFGYIYLNTGKLRNTIIAHMAINFMGSIFAPMLLERMTAEGEGAGIWNILLTGYSVFLVIGAVVGLILLCMNARSLRFPAGSLELPKGKRFRITCVNAGMILMALSCLGMIALSLAV